MRSMPNAVAQPALDHAGRTRRPPRIFPLILLVLGAILFAGGAQLALLGGSLYYIICGATVIASAVLIWRGRRRGVHLYWLMILCTWLWAFWEVGLDGWALMPRVVGPTLLGLWLLTPFVRRRLHR